MLYKFATFSYLHNSNINEKNLSFICIFRKVSICENKVTIQYFFPNFTQTVLYCFQSAKSRAFKFNPKQYKRNISDFQILQKCYEFIIVLQLSFIKLNINQKRELLNVFFFELLYSKR